MTERKTRTRPRATPKHAVSKRATARPKTGGRSLTVQGSDEARRAERLSALAERVFGDAQKARRWLRQANGALNGATPLTYLASEAGTRKIEDMLHQIDHGIFA